MNLEEVVNEYDDALRQLKKRVESVFHDNFMNFFASNPKIYGITWSQYTPYFNDGDTCYFRTEEMHVLGSEEELEEARNGSSPYNFSSTYDLRDKPDMQSVVDFLATLDKMPSEVMEGMFGDGVQVVASRDGFKVFEYEHD